MFNSSIKTISAKEVENCDIRNAWQFKTNNWMKTIIKIQLFYDSK